ncbi:PD-(D/E)XK nuclease family protein, partial [bacterium]|nr:PD-(D/E)XK nuclease family protein [bacterium]
AEARQLAHRLKDLQNRSDYSWGDVLVLVRSVRSVDYLEEAFNAAEIPFVVQSGRGFWDAMEVSDLLALLRCLENPGDDFSMACLLKSPVVGFSDDDLIRLRIIKSENDDWETRPLQQGLLSISEADALDENLQKKCQHFNDIFWSLYKPKDILPLRELFDQWIAHYDLEIFWASVYQGDYMRANVQKFLRICDQYQGISASKLRALFEDLRVRDVKEGTASSPAANRGAMQIMTVHGAKGLEAPIVAVFYMNFGSHAFTDPFVFSYSEGSFFSLNSQGNDAKTFKPAEFLHCVEKSKDLSKSEEERILYVAMTRARDKLLLSVSGALKNGKVQTGGWFEILLKGLQISKEMLFQDDSDERLLINDIGEETGVLLRRGDMKLDESSTPHALISRQAIVAPPSAFPQAPDPILEPISVSEFIQFCIPVTEDDYRLAASEPLEVSGKQTDPSLWGLWLHRILETHLGQQASEMNREEVGRLGLTILHRIPEGHEIDSAISLCSRFTASDLGQQLSRSAHLVNEFPILFKIEDLQLRGKLDLAYRSERGWVLVDFKSDRNIPALDSDIYQKYLLQLQIYAYAWKLLTGEIPASVCLYFLAHGEQIEVSINESDFQQISHRCHDYRKEILGVKTV